jgi:hypothetical protein
LIIRLIIGGQPILLVFDKIRAVSIRIKFRRKFDFAQLPRDQKLFRCSVDWNGDPLLLLQEGKPAQPAFDAPMEVQVAWRRIPPKAHHVIHWEGTSQRTVLFEKSESRVSFYVQRLADGWILCDARGGRAGIYNPQGNLQRAIDVGDAIKDVQTTHDGKIWVSYFDEGVYGSTIGNQGAVCFDLLGRPIFKYFEFAERLGLPFIDDCYAMNVLGEDEVWLSYYSDFPLVAIRAFNLHNVWKEFGCMAGSFGIYEGAVIFPKCYTRIGGDGAQLLRRTFSLTPQTESVEAVDDDGRTIDGWFQVAARNSPFYLWTDTALYQMTSV